MPSGLSAGNGVGFKDTHEIKDVSTANPKQQNSYCTEGPRECGGEGWGLLAATPNDAAHRCGTSCLSN